MNSLSEIREQQCPCSCSERHPVPWPRRWVSQSRDDPASGHRTARQCQGRCPPRPSWGAGAGRPLERRFASWVRAGDTDSTVASRHVTRSASLFLVFSVELSDVLAHWRPASDFLPGCVFFAPRDDTGQRNTLAPAPPCMLLALLPCAVHFRTFSLLLCHFSGLLCLISET